MKIQNARPAKPRVKLSWDLTRHSEWLSLWSFRGGRAIEEHWGDEGEWNNWHHDPPDHIWFQTKNIDGVYHGIYFTIKVRAFKRITLILHGDIPINGVENFF